MEQVIEVLNKIAAVIPLEGIAVVAVGGVIDFALRLTKSEKPMSVVWAIANLVKAAAEVLYKVAAFMDKVLPQKVKGPEA